MNGGIGHALFLAANVAALCAAIHVIGKNVVSGIDWAISKLVRK